MRRLERLRRKHIVVSAIGVSLLVVASIAFVGTRTGDVVLSESPTTSTALPGPTIVVNPIATTVVPVPSGGDAEAGDALAENRGGPIGSKPEIGPRPDLRQPDAAQYGTAIHFESDEPVPDDLVFILVIGSDARPGERLDRTRADSIHLVAVNPRSGTGTIVGLARDTWTDIPGHGRGKINSALSLGGPELVARTIRQTTGLPVDWWVLTGFEGLTAMVNDLGGLIVPVERRMADRFSGAFFDRGFHHMTGPEVLAFSRDRHSVAKGDFSRSENHGTVMLQALRKMRVEVGTMDGVRTWVEVLWRHVRIEAGIDDVVRLGATARRIDPAQVANVVAPGTVGTAGRQSVVYLTEEAARLFEDLRADATIGSAPRPTTTSTTSTTTSTTSAPPTTSTTLPGSTTSSTIDPPVTQPPLG